MDRMKGQAFIMGSVVFSLLLILPFLATGPSIQGPGTVTRHFFSHTLDKSSVALNEGLSENRSIGKAKRTVYSYDRFLERSSLEKGIDYYSYTLVVLPDKGEAVFINYFDSSLDVKLYTGSWTNQTVAAKQSLVTSFSSGTVKVDLEVKGNNHEFDAATPRMLKHSVMNSTGESWKNTLLG